MTLGNDGRLYVANPGSNTVSVINTATNTVIDTNPNVSGTQAIPLGSSPTSVALSPDGGLAYVANGNDTVSVISTKDYTVVSTVAIDSDTSGGHVVAVTPSGTVYVTDAVDKSVRVLVLSATVTPATKLTLLGSSVTITGDVTPQAIDDCRRHPRGDRHPRHQRDHQDHSGRGYRYRHRQAGRQHPHPHRRCSVGRAEQRWHSRLCHHHRPQTPTPHG